MSVLVEHSSAVRDQAAQPLFAQPLPRLSPLPRHDEGHEKYEVVVVGAGPSGMFMNLLLARYGLRTEDLLCIDAKGAGVKSGHADGLANRTVEVFKTMGLADEILNEAHENSESGIWTPRPPGADVPGIERSQIQPLDTYPTRYPLTYTIHQGRIERILADDLRRYSKRGIERSSRLVDVKLDEAGDRDFPIVAEIDHDGHRRTVRAKYLVGADGAHSAVRQAMGVRMEGDAKEDVWGVVDFVADTDFPDIRRFAQINSAHGNALNIARERKNTGDYLNRLYVPMKQVNSGESPERLEKKLGSTSGQERQEIEDEMKVQKWEVTSDRIFERVAEMFKPYYVKVKEGTEIEWWAAYQVGQRVAERFVQKDSTGMPRIFIVGDACHTHTPKAGQGMNVSMLDSYDLSWKLAYALFGLSAEPLKLLDTYEIDRRRHAQDLIEFDKQFYAELYGENGGKMGAGTIGKAIGFITNCGIEYDEGLLVDKKREHRGQAEPSDYDSGLLREGRRLLDTVVRRFANGSPRHIHDDLPSDGRIRIMILTSTDLLDSHGQSASTVISICDDILPRYPPGTVEVIILTALARHSFEWVHVPTCIKREAQMRFHHAEAAVYKTYGVDPAKGAMTVVRADGVVGTIAELTDVGKVDVFVGRILKKVV